MADARLRETVGQHIDDVIGMTVIGALELEDYIAAGVGAGQTQGVKGGLATGAGESGPVRSTGSPRTTFSARRIAGSFNTWVKCAPLAICSVTALVTAGWLWPRSRQPLAMR